MKNLEGIMKMVKRYLAGVMISILVVLASLLGILIAILVPKISERYYRGFLNFFQGILVRAEKIAEIKWKKGG